MKYRLLILLVVAALIAQALLGNTPQASAAAVKAFPGAMGYGTDTPGGRGGRVIYVTNLNDSGSGSLREALQASGPRTVVFKVSGTITLNNDINIQNPFLTIAGQTAPGEGVQIRNAQLKIQTHDVIIRYLKVRSGDEGNGSNPADRDGITTNHDTNAYNIVIDHCTLIWGSDIGGTTFLNGSHDSTVSYSILGEGLYVSRHPEGNLAEGGHSMAMNLTELSSTQHPTRITVHHNLLTTAGDRNPRIIGAELVDFVNNVIYNWKDSPSQGNPRSVNLIKNYYIAGPMTTVNNAKVGWLPKAEAGGSLRNGSVYESGNLGEGINQIRGGSSSVYASSRFSPYSITSEDSPQNAYLAVVADAGANRNVANANGDFRTQRDNTDVRIINNLMNRTGTFFNGVSYNGVGGYPAISWENLDSGPAATDNDNDGMADAWENAYFGNTNRGSANDSSGDYDNDGYTDLEEYLNGTNPADGSPPPPSPTATVPGPTPTATRPGPTPTATRPGPTTTVPAPTPTPGSGMTFTFTPIDDAMVNKKSPEENFGGQAVADIDDSPTEYAYLKFEVTGVQGKVGSVVLRIYSLDGSDEGGRVKVADTNWSEDEITWKTKPDVSGSVIGKLGKTKAGQWYEIDLTGYIKGNGTYAFRIQTPSSDTACYSTKEGSHAPELIITLKP